MHYPFLKHFFSICAGILLLASCTAPSSNILELQTDHFRLSVDDQGMIAEITDLRTKKNHLDIDSVTALLKVRMHNEFIRPIDAQVNDDNLVLDFGNHILAQIKIEKKAKYVTLELVSLSKEDEVELIVWGPFYNTINGTIGETVGVVRDSEFAFGIQSLNIKTLGGYPWNESDRMPAFDVISQDDPNDMHPKADGSVLYRVEAAKPTNTGSSLQAYARNRSQERIISDFKHDKILAPPHADGGVIGSKIALFGVPQESALALLGEIEIAEGLPHPMIDGQWGKKAREAAAAYIITDFTEDNVEEAIALTKKAGLKYMYHYGKTFENWGHFELYKGEFPNGIAGLKKCIEQAEAEGIMVGTHFLSNFITTNDPYVTPIPDPRLAIVGRSMITSEINSSAKEIPIASPEYFNQMENNTLKTVQIGNELIRYSKVSEQAPWKLLDCQRGAFDTQATSHKNATEITKLLDHAYKVFLTNAELTVELSERMAKLYNETGLRQISFDGLEGNRSTGLGTYGESLMPYVWYNNLNEKLKNHLIIDASRTTHFFWHIYSRMNWGEPWYGGFRESQTEYRFKNQAYFKRNYMPGMLGWFKMTQETSLEDVDWLLARSAGYDAGYAFVANTEAIQKNGQTEGILEKIGTWEKLRISNSFSEDQKTAMQDADKEFSLIEADQKSWLLQEIKADIFKHENKVRQPGEPLHSTFNLANNGERQTLHFILSAENCSIENIIIEFENYKKIYLPISLKDSEKLKYEAGKNAIKYDAEWNKIGQVYIDPEEFLVEEGDNSFSIDCQFTNAKKEALLKAEFRTVVKNEEVNLVMKK